jgi:hypothetical protein
MITIGSHISIDSKYLTEAIIIFTYALYGTYENLIRRRLSLFGFDRLGFLFASLFNKILAIQAMKNPKTYIRLGIMQLLIALGVLIYCIKIR